MEKNINEEIKMEETTEATQEQKTTTSKMKLPKITKSRLIQFGKKAGKCLGIVAVAAIGGFVGAKVASK